MKGTSEHAFYINNFFSLENRAICEIKCKNIVERGWLHMAIWCMRIAYWMPEAINTRTVCVILFAFPSQQLLYEQA